MKIHIVQKGDTLEKIAERYEVDFQELKKLNSQLSNPDLIMPGMKIKVPSGGVPVKKEEQPSIRKEFPKKQEHPFAKEKPKVKLDVEDTKPKEKPSVPYVPPVPNTNIGGQSSMPEGDISNFYQNVNQLHQPFVPPKPYGHHEEGPNMNMPWTNEEESHMENVNYPNIPQPSQVGGAEENKYHGMPNVAPAYHQPFPYPYHPGCLIPVSPVLPGTGLCYPWYPYPAQQMPYMPQQQPGYVSPAEYDGDDNMGHDNMGHDNAGHHGYHHQPMNAPAYMPSYQPFPGYAPPNLGHAGDPNMAHTGKDDCGCGPGQYPGGFPGGVPYGQMPPMQQMGSPYGMGGYQQPAGGQMFNRPEDDED
ncbi:MULTISPECIES: SafA/ExsA family spore coat assembly protein [Bacillus]|uniref:SafA/ExsA family spore coat assembly protein n=1 Tax=Bacillus TaxID=1386 RepID=UPI000426859C|nr:MULTISPECIES: SafA/ExsA family spore coat assembly protein [Bacillus]QHZ47898.1 SafA/ExsA family spore coat assembly protein [Bacillus sp. NSP9.1]WFA03979.1 SafA/ExsA family spore coat assembly protein [Bacillus sp. HSf4]